MKTEKIQNKVKLAEKALLQLSDAERLKLFKTFCRWCGGESPDCYCDSTAHCDDLEDCIDG